MALTLGVCRGEMILIALKEVHCNFPSASVYEFWQEVKKLGLGLSSSFEEPCWEGLGIEPYVFIKQDILHGIHKFVWDHLSEWLKKMLGVQEMDSRFIVQPPISTNRFTRGISKLSQITGQEHHAFQKAILPIIAGHDRVDNKVTNAMLSLLDLAYLVQYPSLSESNMHKMEEALSTFHGNKAVFVDNGSWGPS